jgi:hypothetical protein
VVIFLLVIVGAAVVGGSLGWFVFGPLGAGVPPFTGPDLAARVNVYVPHMRRRWPPYNKEERSVVDSAVTETAEQPTQFRALTPSGIEIAYEPEPKRRYLIRQTEGGMEGLFHEEGWAEVPSVTTALEVLGEGRPESWWGMGVGVAGVMTLLDRGTIAARMARPPFSIVGQELVDPVDGPRFRSTSTLSRS